MAQPIPQETEWQFDAQELATAERWLDQRATRGRVTIGRAVTRAQRDTYLDTDDWRLYRAGCALRLRRTGQSCEATLKSLAGSAAGVRRRVEITEPLVVGGHGADVADVADVSDGAGDAAGAAEIVRRALGEVGQRVRAVAGARALRPLFEVHTRRRARLLRIGKVHVGEVALDDTAIPSPDGQRAAKLQRVEVEVNPQHLATLAPLVERFRAACRLQPAVLTKFELGLQAMHLAPASGPDAGAGLAMSRKAMRKITLGELASAVLRKHFAALQAHEPAARLGLDPEAVHDMRVASRRLRSALRLFEAALPGQAQPLRDEWQWAASALGEVRDLDVQISQISDWSGYASQEERAALAVLEAQLRRQHAAARDRMSEALGSPRYERLLSDFTAFLDRGPSRSRAAKQPALKAMPRLIARRCRKARELGDRLAPDSPPADYHAFRIQCKRARYALETVAELYGRPARRMLTELAELQDVLGQYQDTQVAKARLLALAERYREDLPVANAFALGTIAERYTERGDELMAQFPARYRRLKKSSWRRLKSAMRSRRRR